MLSLEDFKKLSLDEQDKYLKEEEDKITSDAKERAWNKMDYGIYDKSGNLIGELDEEEDCYEE